jgi:hypothetical protein
VFRRNGERYFSPGQKAIRGVFWVHHYAHRESHLAVIDYGTFPKCRKCAERVRFEAALRKEAGRISEDPDFNGNAS